MHYVYQARFEPGEDGEILVTVPDVPMVATFGIGETDAIASAADALATALLYLGKEGRPVPAPTTAPGAGLHPISLALTPALKLAVMAAFRESGISKTELGRRLGKADSEAHRILDPAHATKVPMLEAALAALGKQASIEVADAATPIAA